MQKSYFMWEFQAETLYVCPMPCYGARTQYQLKIVTINGISGIVYIRDYILKSSRNVSKTTPRYAAPQ